jgi:Type II CAAX prenyl endopeptidase Rce1-like
MFLRVAPRSPARARPAGSRAAATREPDAREWLLEHRPCSYWMATRRPFPSLLFVAPFVIAYEATVIFLGDGAASAGLRSGADAWMRRALTAAGLSDPWFLPLLLVVILMGWQISRSHDWRFSPAILAGMIAESLIWAVALLGVGRLIDLGFSYLEQGRPPFLSLDPAAARPTFTALIGYVGAGVYEETLFRLMLVPTFFATLRLLQMPQVLASSWAVTASALLFALAHHAGIPGEAFTWYAFIFRWMAGVFFAWVFVIRGFGIAVGTHTAYDILVGWIG